jgi:hypothetical protein
VDKRLPRPPHAIPKIKTSRTSKEEYVFKRAVTPTIPANKKLRTSIAAGSRKIFFAFIKADQAALPIRVWENVRISSLLSSKVS